MLLIVGMLVEIVLIIFMVTVSGIEIGDVDADIRVLMLSDYLL